MAQDQWDSHKTGPKIFKWVPRSQQIWLYGLDFFRWLAAMGRKCLKPWMNLDLDHENPMSSEIWDFREPKKNMYTSPGSRKQQNKCWHPSILTWKQTENRFIVLDLTHDYHDLFWVESSMRVCETAGEFMCSRKSRQPKENHIPVKKNSLSKCWCYKYKCNLNKNLCTTNYNVIVIRIIEGSLEVKLPTIWTVEKQRWKESEEKRSEERRGRCAKR